LRSISESNLQQISNVVDPRWMTLLEALEYIQSVKKCDSVVAQVQLKQGIGQQLIPLKWADSKGPGDKPDVDADRSLHRRAT
jgi:hypothetical protein